MQKRVKIGVNILETLTTGMYKNPPVIYREYIQNSCDQIDDALLSGLLKPDEGRIEIWINDDSVSIEDNATGIPEAEFEETLYSIGESRKVAGVRRGFRGIGHWCGFAFCETLVFTSKAAGESVESIMACDAAKMRSMMLEHRLKRANYSIYEVLSSTTTFSTNKVRDVNAHYFKVELLGITDAAEVLCNEQEIKNYLSFVVPVGYAPQFTYRSEIHKHAKEIGQPMQEYNITVNGGAVLKKYTRTFTTSKGEDIVTGVSFKELKDSNGNLIAWLWFGLSRFQGVLKQENMMRGIRLRSQNIQIGDDNTLQKLFKEDRGQHYFIGEVFAISEELLPDGQRDYFEAGEARLQFECLLYDFFNDELSRIYKVGSAINSKFDKIVKVEKIAKEITTVQTTGGKVADEKFIQLEKAKKEAEIASQELHKIRQKTEIKTNIDSLGTYDFVVNEIFKRNDEERISRPEAPPIQTPLPSAKIKSEPVVTPVSNTRPSFSSSGEATDKMVSLSKVRKIIRDLADSSIAEVIIAKIEEEMD